MSTHDPRQPADRSPAVLRLGLVADGRHYEGSRLFEPNRDGVGLAFRAGEDAPDVGIGTVHDIWVKGPDMAEPVLAAALVVTRRETASEKIYRLELVDTQALLSRLPARYRQHFNRREAYRVQPDRTPSIVVRVESLDGERVAHATVQDISVAGLGLEVERATEERFAGDDLVLLSFRLPTARAAVDAVARVAVRRLEKGTIVWGLRFDADRTCAFEHVQSVIHEYVLAHGRSRRELARAARRHNLVR